MGSTHIERERRTVPFNGVLHFGFPGPARLARRRAVSLLPVKYEGQSTFEAHGIEFSKHGEGLRLRAPTAGSLETRRVRRTIRAAVSVPLHVLHGASRHGNPTRTSGFFYDTHHSLRHRWHTMQVNCLDVPRAQGHIEDIKAKYGQGSNANRVRVLGEFPTSDDESRE
jgi:hypothetical protein